jgi:hypothetical protein
MSELLREQHCEGEVDEQENRKKQAGGRNPIHVHGLPQVLTGLDVEKRHGKENGGEQHHDRVLHFGTPVTAESALAKIEKTASELAKAFTSRGVDAPTTRSNRRFASIGQSRIDSVLFKV